MTEFDQLFAEADEEIFDTLGGWVQLTSPTGQNLPLRGTFDRDYERFIDGNLQYLGPVITLLGAPQNLNLYTFNRPEGTYTLRERIKSDARVCEYACTLNGE